MHLEHVNMTVADLERSAAFYGRLLGLEVRWRGTTSEGAPALHLGDETCYLALFQGEGHADWPDYDAVGLNHVGFVVDDLAVARDRLRELGATVHHEADYEPGRRLYFRDPDGIEIELVEYPQAPS